jgi:hypothetical protein
MQPADKADDEDMREVMPDYIKEGLKAGTSAMNRIAMLPAVS